MQLRTLYHIGRGLLKNATVANLTYAPATATHRIRNLRRDTSVNKLKLFALQSTKKLVTYCCTTDADFNSCCVHIESYFTYVTHYYDCYPLTFKHYYTSYVPQYYYIHYVVNIPSIEIWPELYISALISS